MRAKCSCSASEFPANPNTLIKKVGAMLIGSPQEAKAVVRRRPETGGARGCRPRAFALYFVRQPLGIKRGLQPLEGRVSQAPNSGQRRIQLFTYLRHSSNNPRCSDCTLQVHEVSVEETASLPKSIKATQYGPLSPSSPPLRVFLIRHHLSRLRHDLRALPTHRLLPLWLLVAAVI